jgi:hypothetical protein
MTPTSPQPLRVLSLGAGVQSSTVLLMSVAGELPRLEAAIFADTGWEPRPVYQHLAKVQAAAEAAGIAVYRVSKGHLRRDALDPAHRFASMPLHVRNQDGGKGMIRRQCTREYKLDPIRAAVRHLWQQSGRPPVEQWIGISLDEAQRMRTSGVRYITNVYPLVDRRLTRWDCQRWLQTHGWPDVPKSACVGCPFRSNHEWRWLRDHDPDGWADAIAFDRAIRYGHQGGNGALLGQAFLHASLLPLDEVDLSTPEDHGQLSLLDGFGMECQGVCGV